MCSNLIFIAASTSAILGLTWGGVAYEWTSYKVLVPLILGLAGIVLFVYLERYAKHPTVPFDILTTRTAIAGYITTFLHSVVVLAVRELSLSLSSLPRIDTDNLRYSVLLANLLPSG